MPGTLADVFFFVRVRERFFIRKSFTKVGYYQSLSLYTLQLVKGYHLLPSGGPAGEWYRTFTFPFIGSSQASEGEASPQPNTMVLKHILALAAKARLCESQTTRPLVFAFPLMRPLLMAGVCGWGYFRKSSAKE